MISFSVWGLFRRRAKMALAGLVLALGCGPGVYPYAPPQGATAPTLTIDRVWPGQVSLGLNNPLPYAVRADVVCREFEYINLLVPPRSTLTILLWPDERACHIARWHVTRE